MILQVGSTTWVWFFTKKNWRIPTEKSHAPQRLTSQTRWFFPPPPPKKKKDPCKASFTHFTFAITLLYFWHLWSSWSFGLALQTLILIVCYLHAVVIKTKRLELTEKQAHLCLGIVEDVFFCSFFYVCLKMMDSSWTRNLPAQWLHFWYSGSPHLDMLDCDAAMLQKCIVVGFAKATTTQFWNKHRWI